jgi:putative pathogen-specific surface antigen
MQMNASDGPHYGANIALPDAGTYQLTLKIHSPAENGWMLHVDKETGVEGRFWTTPIELSWDWQYTPHEW